MTQNHAKPYKEMMINSDKLEVPRSTYQRELVLEEVIDISNHFNECIANEPKVSFRDGRYFVFDGQHTVAARVHRNGGTPLPILCQAVRRTDRIFDGPGSRREDPGAGICEGSHRLQVCGSDEERGSAAGLQPEAGKVPTGLCGYGFPGIPEGRRR